MRKLYRNARLQDSETLQDILVEDGRFAGIGPDLKAEGAQVIDLAGKLVTPPYVDPHIHLDYVYTARQEGATNQTGTLFEGIQRWSETKAGASLDEIKARARRAVREEMAAGVQYIRTHADVTDPAMTSLKALLELRDELKDIVTIQIVAFPQEGMYAYKGGDELVEEGLRMGADCVGAIPHFELAREFGEKSVHKAVELALKYDKLIDLHCDETDDDQSRFLELLTALTYQAGIGDRTTASHTCSFGSANNAYAFRLMKTLVRAKLNFISCPTENIYLEGRQDSYPKRRGLTRVKELHDAGINVCFAQDSISDPWYPLGNGNLMNILDHGIHICQMMSFEEIDHALDLITVNGARTMHLLDQYGIEVGKPANFVVLDAPSPFEAIRQRAGILRSVRDGRELFVRIPSSLQSDVPLFA
ncbi:cytosine deaminase [Mitsuokella sp.]|uniref:cytosine deaminase n=1 Tax=Mitsuokella sp. TaxID=2049034 RepID=UPI002A81309E|nr:cytosine deaminase [Mitsuokella sp.]MDY4475327.1 cytosine deaminase [Mitsuokella sp.]